MDATQADPLAAAALLQEAPALVDCEPMVAETCGFPKRKQPRLQFYPSACQLAQQSACQLALQSAWQLALQSAWQLAAKLALWLAGDHG